MWPPPGCRLRRKPFSPYGARPGRSGTPMPPGRSVSRKTRPMRCPVKRPIRDACEGGVVFSEADLRVYGGSCCVFSEASHPDLLQRMCVMFTPTSRVNDVSGVCPTASGWSCVRALSLPCRPEASAESGGSGVRRCRSRESGLSELLSL
jgi:hypothetical protein